MWQRGWNPRDFAENTWRRVDDRPFGGGPGMLMQAGAAGKAIAAAKAGQCVRQAWPKSGHLPFASGDAAPPRAGDGTGGGGRGD